MWRDLAMGDDSDTWTAVPRGSVDSSWSGEVLMVREGD